MAKPLQSVCKRTRSKSKQTSLLDFEIPGAGSSSSRRRRHPSSSSTTASATATAAAVAVPTDDNATDIISGDGSKRHHDPTATSSGKRAASSVSRASSSSSADPPGRSSSSSGRGTSKKKRVTSSTAAAATAAAVAASNKTETTTSPDPEIPASSSSSNKKRRRSTSKCNAKASDKKASTTKRTSNRDVDDTDIDKPREAAPDSAAPSNKKIDNKRKKRSTVCYDVVAASVEKKKQQQRSSSSVTPSPYPMAKKEAAGGSGEKDDGSSPPSSSSAVSTAASEGSTDNGRESEVTTPLNRNAKRKKSCDVDASNKQSLQVERSVTVDTLLDASSSRLQSSMPSTHQQHQQQPWQRRDATAAIPAYHHPWMKSYTPAVRPHKSTLPPGVHDIDLLPHHCCPASLASHGGYSWITSKRRCSCLRDADHCSGEAVAEAYLGSYGAERYGDVGLAGIVGGDAVRAAPAAGVNEADWKAERWWLERTARERGEARKDCRKDGVGKCLLKNLVDVTRLGDDDVKRPTRRKTDDNDDDEGSRTPSPTSALSDASSDSDASSLKSTSGVAPPPPRKTKTPNAITGTTIPTSVEEHLNYMPRQPHINVEMRGILVDWLLEVCEEYKLSTETFWLSVTLVDRSLACSYVGEEYDDDARKGGVRMMIVQKDKLQLLGCACTLIASKLIEITPPSADDFVYISDKTYARKEILEMESKVCDVLKFNLGFRTPCHHVDRFLRASRVSSERSPSSSSSSAVAAASLSFAWAESAQDVLMRRLVSYLLDLAALEYGLATKKPALVAAAAVYLARATLGTCEPSSSSSSSSFGADDPSPSFRRAALSGFWSKTLEYYTGYDLWDLEETVKMLHLLHEGAEDGNLASAYNKHKANKNGRVALKTVLNEEGLGFL